MDFREKIRQRNRSNGYTDQFASNDDIPENLAETEPLIRSDFFTVENIRNPINCLDLRLADGVSRGIPYSYITEIVFNPSEGIEIQATNKRINIEGRNLRVLYNYLVAFRVKFIQMNMGNDLTDEKNLFVKKIIIEEN